MSKTTFTRTYRNYFCSPGNAWFISDSIILNWRVIQGLNNIFTDKTFVSLHICGQFFFLENVLFAGIGNHLYLLSLNHLKIRGVLSGKGIIPYSLL